jgi:hypothetical protein
MGKACPQIWFYNHLVLGFQNNQKLSSRRGNMMLPKRLFLGVLLLTPIVMITGCATTDDYKDDPARRYRIASEECIRFGHVTGSDGYYNCVEKRVGSGIEIASTSEYAKQTSFKIPPPPSLAELLGFDVNETGQVSANGEWENGVTELTRIPTLSITPQDPVIVLGAPSDDYTLLCRTRVFTGSRFKHKICAPIAEWAWLDRENRGKTEKLYRDLDKTWVNRKNPQDDAADVGHMPRNWN